MHECNEKTKIVRLINNHNRVGKLLQFLFPSGEPESGRFSVKLLLPLNLDQSPRLRPGGSTEYCSRLKGAAMRRLITS